MAPVALITGGASGIGLAVVRRLYKKGFNICVFDANRSAAGALHEEFGDRVLFHHGNVVEYEDQAMAFKRTYEKWGQINFTFANAGIGDRMDFYQRVEAVENIPPKPDTLALDVCLLGAVWTSYLSIFFFRKSSTGSGLLVMTSSIAGLYPAAAVPLYGAAKHAVIGLARSTSKRLQELGEKISVNVVCPGFVATPLVSSRLVEVVPRDMITPAETIVNAIEAFLEKPEETGKVAECSGTEIIYRSVIPYGNPQAEYWVEGGYKNLVDENEVARDSEAKGKLL